MTVLGSPWNVLLWTHLRQRSWEHAQWHTALIEGPVTKDNCTAVRTFWLEAPTASFLYQRALRDRFFRAGLGGKQRDVRNECLHLGADEIGLESACEESAACLGRAFSDCKAGAAAEDLGPLGHVSTGEQDELLRVRRHFRDFSYQFPGAQHCTWGIVSDHSLLPNISIWQQSRHFFLQAIW